MTIQRHLAAPHHLLVRALLASVLLLAGAGMLAQAENTAHPGYDYTVVGNVNSPTPGKTSPGLLLMGGGREIDAAFRWFAGQAGHGHIVVLGASAPKALRAIRDYIYKVGKVASVETLYFHSRKAASNPRVLAIVKHADGIYIKGGDQSRYVRMWKGTPLARAIDAHVRDGKPLGGTSAGYAILGQWAYGAMDGNSLLSPNALQNPEGPSVTVVGDFLHLARLKGTITDTHFVQRSRLGRLLTFVAHAARHNHSAAITGLGIDQGTALLVSADGNVRILSHHPDGHAWVVIPHKLREVERADGRKALAHYLAGRVTAGKPLNVPGYIVIGLGTSSHLHLPDYTISDPAFVVGIDVDDGRLVEHPARGKAVAPLIH